MKFKVSIYDRLVRSNLMVRVTDLDNEGKSAMLKIHISKYPTILELKIDHISQSPLDIFVPGTPITGKIHEVTAEIYSDDKRALHDTDTRLIRLNV
jgi:hypothetical protein